MWNAIYNVFNTEAKDAPSCKTRRTPLQPPPPPIPQRNYTFKEREARKNNPAVKDAWEKYQITLKLAIGAAPENPFASRVKKGRSM